MADLGTERGAATAELAVAMPAALVVMAAVLSVGQAVLTQVSCVDAARAGARAAARGDSIDHVREVAAAAVDEGAQPPATTASGVDVVATAGDQVAVTVSRSVRLMVLGPPVRVSARATAVRELPVGTVP